MKSKLLLSLLALALFLLIARTLRDRGTTVVPVASGGAEPEDSSADRPSALAPATATAADESRRSAGRGTAQPDLERPPELGDVRLRVALRRIAGTDMQDEAALEAALFPVIASPPNLARTLELLQGGGLSGDGERLSLEEIGAIRALLCAAILFHAPEGFASDLHHAGLAQDGRAFLERLLRALALVLPPTRETLAELLASARGPDDRLLFDLSFETLMRELAARHPELSELYLGLLAGVLAESRAPEAEALDLFELESAESPRLLTASLARLLAGARSQEALRWAEDLYDHGETSVELRNAISIAVATAAPVDEAAVFLAARADSKMHEELLTLGDREGGLEALEDAYYQRRIRGAEADARRMLVSGMQQAGPRELLAIASEDPDARVRGQAGLTLTASPDFSPTAAVLTFLGEGFANRSDAEIGLPDYAVVYSVANFARAAQRNASPALDHAVVFLREIAGDTSLDVYLRRHALTALASHLSAAEHAALTESLNL